MLVIHSDWSMVCLTTWFSSSIFVFVIYKLVLVDSSTSVSVNSEFVY